MSGRVWRITEGIENVSLQLGHTEINTTQKFYGHLKVKDRQKTSETMGKIVNSIVDGNEEHEE